MRLLRLAVSDFGTIHRAEVGFGAGLNVLYGPNDLGKSTLAAALRAVLLVQPQSSAAREFVPWTTDRIPSATATLEIDGRIWRVHKAWTTGSGRKATLEWSNDGHTFTVAQEGRAVDGELRRLLGWGIPEPGGRGGKHGLPRSFLSTVLLGEQAVPYRIFDNSLADDPEDSGRERLTEALQALANDPLFAEVLSKAQERVDRAFTQTGRKKQNKASPFKQVADEIRRREEIEEQLASRVAESEAVARRLSELDEERDRRMTQRADAAERVEILDRDLQRVRAATAAAAEVARAKQELDEIERNREEIRQLAETEASLAERLPELAAAVEAAAERRSGAQSELERARQQVASIREGGDAQEKLRRQTLEARRLELRARTHELEERLQAAQRALDAEAAAREATRLAEAAAAAEKTASEAVDAATATAESLELEERIDALAVAWLEAQRCEAAVADADVAAREARRHRQEAAALRERAQAMVASLAALALPDPAGLDRIRAVARDRELARARLGGGLSVSVESRGEHEPPVLVSLDDGTPSEAAPGTTRDAQRELSIAWGQTRVHVTAGDREVRQALQEAERAWVEEVQPVLTAAGAGSLAELEATCARAQDGRTEAARLEDEAQLHVDGAERREPVAAELEDRRRAHGQALSRLEGVSQEWLTRAREVATAVSDVGTLRGRIEDRRATVGQARAAVADAKSVLADARAQARVERERADAAVAQARKSVASIEGPAEERLSRGRSEAEALLEQGRAIETELAALDRGGAQRVADAEQALARADAAVGRAKADEAEAREALDACKQELASARGQLSVRREQASRYDPLAAAERFAALRDRHDALPKATREVTEEDLAAAKAAFEAADQALDEALAAVRKQEGALQQVGGQVVREKADAAREALEAARRREAEVQLEYEGWRLLVETLRQAENEEGQHLGRSLGRSVGERFERLTAGRYGTLELGPELQARGVRTRAAGVQNIDALSEGLKEQLATVLRISVAEQIDGMLLLDDHLTQTDPERVAWFRDLLRTAAERIQIIVMTCRVDDYLDAAERPVAPQAEVDTPTGVHAVALARVIRRIE